MFFARVLIVVIGVTLPYLARLPGIPAHGIEWLTGYFGEPVVMGVLFFGAFNAIAWGAILGCSWMYRSPWMLLFPAVPGFGILFWAHSTVDLSADAQAALALVVIPFYAVVPAVVGALIGLAYEAWRWRANALY